MNNDYERFGEEWEKEMMKFDKKGLIDLLRKEHKIKYELELLLIEEQAINHANEYGST